MEVISPYLNLENLPKLSSITEVFILLGKSVEVWLWTLLSVGPYSLMEQKYLLIVSLIQKWLIKDYQ